MEKGAYIFLSVIQNKTLLFIVSSHAFITLLYKILTIKIFEDLLQKKNKRNDKYEKRHCKVEQYAHCLGSSMTNALSEPYLIIVSKMLAKLRNAMGLSLSNCI